jgi:putative SOS response-associated peptidase YedK
MCGRVKLEGDFSELKIKFSIPPDHPAPNYAPSWNVAPTDKLPIVHYNPKTEARALDLMRWGLVPYWAKDFKIGFSTINAMAETVDTKPVFREAFKRRRCLVPVEAYYEWKKLDAKTKQPYAFGLAGGGIMALAGLWETWKSPAEELVRSFTIVTTTPNELCAAVITACRSYCRPRCGRPGSAKIMSTARRRSKACSPPTLPSAWQCGRLARVSAMSETTTRR